MVHDAWVQYLDRIGRIPLLTRSEVIAAVRRVRRGTAAQQRLDNGPPPPADEVAVLAAAAADGERAKELLVTSNLRLVVSIARRYRVSSIPLPDLVQEGAFGLLRAVDKFDHERGIAFSTYATWWIRQAVSSAVAEQARSVRVPKHVGHQIAACIRARDELAERLGEVPSADQLAEALGSDADEVRVLLRSAAPAQSLQRFTGEPAAYGEDMLSTSDEACSVAEQAELRDRLSAALRRLPAVHRAVLRERVGWGDGRPQSIRTVARTHGISRDVAHRIENEAWQMLRQLPQVDGLRDWLGA